MPPTNPIPAIVRGLIVVGWACNIGLFEKPPGTASSREKTVASLQSADDNRLGHVLALPFRGAVPVPAYEDGPVAEPIALLVP
jgi:hypothetical protein